MTFAALLTQVVQVSRFSPGSLDNYGNPTATWAAPVSYNGRLQHVTGDEKTVDRDTQVSDWLLFLGPSADIHGRDRVVYAGKTFEVIGPPDVVHHPSTGPHHVEARLRHVEG